MAKPVVSATRTVQFIRQPQDSIGVLCSIPSILYNSSSASTVSFKVQMAEGADLVAPGDARVGFVQKGSASNLPALWANGRTVSGVRLDYALDTEALNVTLTISQDATLEGMFHFSLQYRGKTYPYSLSMIKVEDCVEGAPGKNGVAFMCSSSSVVYKGGEASSHDFEVCVMDGAVRVLPEYVSGRMVLDGEFVEFDSSLDDNGMALTQTANADHYNIHLSFTDDCCEEGELQLVYQYKVLTYTARVQVVRVGDGIPGADAAVLITDTAAVAYNPSQATSLTVKTWVKEGVELHAPTFGSARLLGPGNTVLKIFTLLGNSYRNMTAVFSQGDGCHEIGLSFAEAEFLQSAFGVLEVAYIYEGQPFTLRLPITRVRNGEQGENAVMLVPSCNSVVYNPSEYVCKAITFEIADGARRIPTTLSDVRFNGEEAVSGTDSDGDGLILTWLGHTTAQGLTIELDEDTTAEGVIDVSTVYGGRTYTTQINIMRVLDGERGDDGNNAVRLETSCDSVVYNNAAGYQKNVSVLIKDGDEAVNVTLSSVSFNGTAVPIIGNYSANGMALSYGPPSFNAHTGVSSPATVALSFEEGATAQGTVEVTTNYNGKQYKAEISVTRVENGKDGEDGKDASWIDCKISALVYREGVQLITHFKADLYADGVKVEANDLTREGYLLDNEGNRHEIGSSYYQGAFVKYYEDEDEYTAMFANNAEFEGELILTLSNDSASRSIQIPILRLPKAQNGKNSITLEASCNSVVYNNTKAYQKVISFLVSDGGEPQIVSLSSVRFNGNAVDPTQGYEADGLSIGYDVPRFSAQTGVTTPVLMTISAIKGATASGTIEVSANYDGKEYKAEVSLTCVENGESGEDAISLVSSTNAISYNPVVPKIVTVSVVVMEGSTAKRPDFLSAVFADNSGIGWDYNSQLTENCGMSLSQAFDGNRHRVTLGFAVDATADGVLTLTYRYKGVVLPLQISVTRIENGIRGFNGASPRGPRLWSDVKAEHSEPDDTEKFFSGKDGEEWRDIVLHINPDGDELYYTPTKTHLVRESPNPGDDTEAASEYWQMLSGYKSVATDLLLARQAKIKNLVAEGIEMNEDVNGVRKVVFSASKYQENGQTKAVVYASRGKFENVEVVGDIQCNTQTYKANMLEDTYHPLTKDEDLGTHEAIEVRPMGGCIIIPPGKSDMVVLLPEVTEGTVRQVTIINQKLPFRGTMRNGRGVFLMCDTENVWIFPKLTTTEGAINSTGNDNIILEYGAYSLYGYHMTIPNDPDDEEDNKDVTVWSLWRTDPVNYHYPTLGDPVRPTNPSIINGVASTLPQL